MELLQKGFSYLNFQFSLSSCSLALVKHSMSWVMPVRALSVVVVVVV